MPLDLSKISKAESHRLRVLFAIRALADGQSRYMVPREQIRAALDAEPDMVSVNLDDLLIQLNDAGLAHVYRAIAGVQSAAVLPLGSNLAAEFDAARRSLIAKRAWLKNAYLRWVYEEQLSGRRTSQEDFLQANITFHGNPFSPEEVGSASGWLEREGFIEGPGAWGVAGPVLPKITTKGEHTVENNKSASDIAPTGGNTFNTTVHGDANIAQASSNFSQSISKTWVTQAAEVLASVEQALATLPPEAVEKLNGVIPEAKEALKHEHPGRVRAAFEKLIPPLTGITVGALGQLLAQSVTNLLATIPM